MNKKIFPSILFNLLFQAQGMDAPKTELNHYFFLGEKYTLPCTPEEEYEEFSEEALKKTQKYQILEQFPNLNYIPLCLNTFNVGDPKNLPALEIYNNYQSKQKFQNYDNINIGFPMKDCHPRTGFYGIPNGKGPFPCAVLLHGSNGLQVKDHIVAQKLLKNGIAVLIFDRFQHSQYMMNGKKENVYSTVENQLILSIEEEIIRALSALKFMQTHPKINPQKTGFIGWSRGGIVALESCLKSNINSTFPKINLPAFNICYSSMPLVQKKEVPIVPTLFLHGIDDDYTPLKQLRSYLEFITEEYFDISYKTPEIQKFSWGNNQLIIYPDSGHAFDLEQPTPNIANDITSVFTHTLHTVCEFIEQTYSDTIHEAMNLSSHVVREENSHFRILKTNQLITSRDLEKHLTTDVPFGVTIKINPKTGKLAWKETLAFIQKQTS